MIAEFANCPKVVGVKQTKRAVESGSAGRVFLAADADPRVIEPIAALCADRNVPVEQCPSMKELGKACGIAVGAAVAAALK